MYKKENVSNFYEKVVVVDVCRDFMICFASQDDIITLISGTKVMSLKHAMKLMKNSGDR